MRPVFIYGLYDPTTRKLRYVGKTINSLAGRLSQHITAAKKRNCHAACWVNSLLVLGHRPLIGLLDIVPDSEWEFWEREYIQNYRERGYDLTNYSDGGDECPMLGKKHTPEANEKNRLAHVGKPAWNKGKVCPTISAAQTGLVRSPETCIRIGNSKRGRKNPHQGHPQTPEANAKRSVTLTGRTQSPEHIKNSSASRRGLKRSAAARANMCAAQQLRRVNGALVYRSHDSSAICRCRFDSCALHFPVDSSFLVWETARHDENTRILISPSQQQSTGGG